MRAPTWGRISQRFHFWHQALDIVAPFRTPIYAPESGKVTHVGQMGSGINNAGLVVQIGYPGGNAHRLCHLDSHVVKKGQSVKQGQLVGYMGHTGYTIPWGIRGTHLHWIVFRNGRRVNPANYVNVPSSPPSTPSPKMPKIGSTITLLKGVNRTTYKKGTRTRAGTIRPKNNWVYTVRGYDPVYGNRIIINSASGGGKGIALALYYTNGKRIEGWK